MNAPEITEKLIYHIQKAQEMQVQHILIFKSRERISARHEFLFFIKPEITIRDRSIKIEEILKMMFQKLTDFQFRIKDIRILGASYLEQFDIIARHYGVINAMSRNPLEYITPEGSEKFRSAFGKLPQDTNIAGGIQFLGKYRNFNPVMLDELWQQSKAVKLAGGTYCASVMAEGEQVFLINGFHPRQLLHFTQQGRSIVAFTIASDIDWSVARNSFIGKTNPEDAESGSLRHELLKNSDRFGLDSINSSRNGFHLSAGPVEGLVELMRYCSDFSSGEIKTTDDFQFGIQINEEFLEEQVRKICDNNFVIHNGSKVSVFDLTEEKNADTALKLLKESSFDQ
jgi:hypothetical protein